MNGFSSFYFLKGMYDMKILTAYQTKIAEQIAYNRGISSERLMENAGSAAARVINQSYDLNGKLAVVIVGQGNNGGDGYVVARKLKEYGAKVAVIMAMGIAMTRDSATMQRRAMDKGISVMNFYDNTDLSKNLIDTADIIVDAIFGIGFHGAADREIALVIERANQSRAQRIALDIPSGVIADTGEVLGSAVKADLTISFIGYKPCHFEYSALEFCGRVKAVSIGIDDAEIVDFFAEVIDVKQAIKNLSKIPLNAHKGTKGTALIIGGSFGMAGAPMLAAKASMRSGVGIVKVCLPSDVYSAAAPMLPEAVFAPKNGKNGFLCGEDIKADLFKNVNSVLIGPGMGNNEDTLTAVSRAVAFSKVPTVIDADGLNAISCETDILKSDNVVAVTPHPGEMSRLIGKPITEIQKNRIGTALEFAKEYKVITVLKGSYTVIACPSGKVYINITGNAAMATAGSGDMLGGMIAAFLANGTIPEKAVVAAVCLHGAAGDYLAEKMGVRGVITTDMIECLPFVLRDGDF